MARQYAVDDSEWEEVRFINGYALFMGYLMMGVRGLGLLVITWTTVVRLAGSVSALGNKDFWCLTGIMLIQTAGVFNFLLKEKISDTVHSWWGLFVSVIAAFVSKDGGFGIKRLIISYVLVAIQVLVFGVILCALGVVYMLGMYISAGVSLWRLIEHDFGHAGGGNQGLALQVLYISVVAQGVLFGYKTIFALVVGGSRLANVVAREFGIEVDKELVAEYLEETVAGCEKDPSFATGRNFVTYGVDLMMEAKSNEGFIDGIKVLGSATNGESGRKVLAKYLLTRWDDSSSAIIQRLLETIGPRSPYSREIKEQVVRILDIIAPCIRLEQFPRAVECLCSVVDTSEESNQLQGNHTKGSRRYDDYKFKEYEKDYVKHQLFKNAVNLIDKLVADEYNRLIMPTCVSNTMLHKIAMLPTKLHRENHYPCRANHESELQMLEQSWALTESLLVALTVTSSLRLQPATPVGEGWQRRRRSEEIQQEEVEEGEEQLLLLRTIDGSALGSSIKRTIKYSIESTIKCIFDCLDCSATQKRQAIQIILHLSLDNMSFIVKDSESSSRRLRWILLLILCSTHDDSENWMVPSLTYPNKNCGDFDGIRRLAGEKLSEMLREKHELPLEESARELQSIRLALGDLINASCADAEDISIRIHAIKIMNNLCVDYTRYSEVVEEFLVDAIPEVVKETLIRCGPKIAERQEQATDDVENGNVSQDNQDGCIDTERRLRKALASLCYFGYMYGYSIPTLRSKFKETLKEQGKSVEDFNRLIHQSIK